MNILVLICNITIPIIIIAIGLLYTINAFKKIDTILDLIVPIAMIISGISDNKKTHTTKNTNTLIVANKKCGVMWICSGLFMLIAIIVLLVLNKSKINNINSSLLVLECMLFVAIFAVVEYHYKRKLYNESNE